jgi:hypothetical protein
MTTPPKTKAVDAKMQAVFDALDAYIQGTAWVSANGSSHLDGSGTTHTFNCSDQAQNVNSFTYTERIAGIRVSISPTSATLSPGQTQQFTATATNADGSAVATPSFTWTMGANALGTVDTTGLYTAPATVNASVLDTVTATLTSSPAWASVTVQLQTT